jgi:acetolactate decarboxylase
VDERWETSGAVIFQPFRAVRGGMLLMLALGISSLSVVAQSNGPVIATGAMRNTMFNGQISGLITLDSLAVPGTYGIGPVEYLQGEVLVLDGIVYRSMAQRDESMTVEVKPKTSSPFFVHQHVASWTAVKLPDTVTDLPSLDAFLTMRYAALGQPLAFRLSGKFTSIDAHIVDVPTGTTINGPDDAHRDNKHYRTTARPADALGFFSTKHKAVFTHHDTNIHVHAITAERNWMGHVEAMRFEAGSMSLLVALP